MSAVITKYGVQASTQAEIMRNLATAYRTIYGEDIELEPNTPDGQVIGIFAQMMSDYSELMLNLFASLFPSMAEGNYLDWNLDLINMRRVTGSPAAVNLRLDFEGTYDIEAGSYVAAIQGVNFTNDKAITTAGLYAFTAADSGSMQFVQNEPVNVITPVIGITASYASTISNGAEYESDTNFRRRWRDKVMNRSRSATQIAMAIEQIDNVEDCKVYDIYGGSYDGIPTNSIYAVVRKGTFDYDKVLEAIYRMKPPGIRSYYNHRGREYVNKLFGEGLINIGFDFATTDTIPASGFKFSYRASNAEVNNAIVLDIMNDMRFGIGEPVFVSDVERFVVDRMPEIFPNKGNNINGGSFLPGQTGVIHGFQ